MSTKNALGKKIFQFRNATDKDIQKYLDICNISINLHLFKCVISKCSADECRKFVEHYNRYGDNVTLELFLKRPITSNAKKIAEHYGCTYKPKKRNNIYDPVYISKREGISLQEAEEFIERFKSDKATSKENFIKKYGKEEGIKRYNHWFKSSLQKGVDSSDSTRSKRHRDYYLKRGYSEEESIEMASRYNRENSPLHIEYYIKRGKNIDYARKKIRQIHDKKIGRDSYREKLQREGYDSAEIDAIIKDVRGSCSREKLGEQEFEERIAKTRSTFESKGMWVPLEDLSDYELYRNLVQRYTNRNDLKSLPNYEKRGRAGIDGAYHLDHKYSIQQGYVNGVSPELIGSIKNLEFIPWEENVKKQTNCSIDLEDLYEN